MTNPVLTYILEVKNELTKVSWPTKEETIRLTALVVIVSAVVAIYLGVLDFALSLLLRSVL